MEHWNERARRRLTDLGLVQEDLCQPLRVQTSGAVGHYLCGRRQPTPAQLVALARTLRCSLDWLMTGIGSDEVDYPVSTSGESLTPDEYILLERYRQIAPPVQSAVQMIINALAMTARIRHRKKGDD